MHASQKSGKRKAAREKRKAESGKRTAEESCFQLSAFSSPLSSRRGFTLVELLVVIVIIGILAGFIMGGVIAARTAARRAVISQEIKQLSMALETYKNEVGEYPPDFALLNHDGDVTSTTNTEDAVKEILFRHVRMRFPRFQKDSDSDGDVDWDDVEAEILANYGVDISDLDPAGALLFWLGGLPENPASNTPAGFNANPANPFQVGLPRTAPYYDFVSDEDRLEYADGGLLRWRYFPDLPAGIGRAPFVYFRAQRAPNDARTYVFMHRDPSDSTQYVTGVRSWSDLSNPTIGRAVPYLKSSGPPVAWESEATYQIISAGLDGQFGDHADPGNPVPDPGPPPPMTYDYPVTSTGTNFYNGDYDNQTSFTEGKLEDEMQ